MKKALTVLLALIFLHSVCRAEEFSVVEEETEFDRIEAATGFILGSMTLREKLCQLFFTTPESLAGDAAADALDDRLREALADYPVGGIVLFGQNMRTPPQLKSFTEDLREYSLEETGIGLLIGGEELGNVSAIALKFGLDTAAAGDDPKRAGETGAFAAARLSEYGFNLNFAPLGDLKSEGEGEVDSRAFSNDPQTAAQCVSAFIRAQSAYGIISVCGHFPGIGNVSRLNTFRARGKIYDSEEAMSSEALIPFRAAMDSGTGMILVTGVSAYRMEKDVPCCFSYQAVTGLLREKMGYDGVVITDSLRAPFASSYAQDGKAAVLAIEAGCDMLLLPKDFSASLEGLEKAVLSGRIPEARIDESVRRILTLKAVWGHLGLLRSK